MPCPQRAHLLHALPARRSLSDADFRVVAVVLRLPPWRFVGSRTARQVLKLRADEVLRLGIQWGDKLLLQDS